MNKSEFRIKWNLISISIDFKPMYGQKLKTKKLLFVVVLLGPKVDSKVKKEDLSDKLTYRRHINQTLLRQRDSQQRSENNLVRRKKAGGSRGRDGNGRDRKTMRRTERRWWVWPAEGQSLSINMKNYLSICPLCLHVSPHTHREKQVNLRGKTDWIFSGINRDLAQCNDTWVSWLAIWWHCAVWPPQAQ